MKNNDTCPKCKGTDLILVKGNAGGYGAGNNIQIGFTNFSAILVHRYVCCGCGYTEEWINKEDLSKLKKKYQ